MGVRELARRLIFDRLTLGSSFLTILLALTLLAAGPIYSDAVTLGALRRSLADAPGNRSGIEIEIRNAPGDYRLANDVVAANVGLLLADTGGTGTRSIESESFVLPGESVGGRSDLAVFVHLQSLDRHATLVDGAWPSSSVGRTEVAIDERSAAKLDLAVTDALDLAPTRAGLRSVSARVVGIYAIDDPSSSFWIGQDRVVDGGSESRSFRTFPLMATPEALLDGIASRVTSRWHVRPDFDRLALPGVQPLRSRVARLEADLRGDLAASDADPQAFSEFTVQTGLPGLLAGFDRSLTVTRSSVLAVIVQLGLLAGYSLVLVAGLVVDARTTESELLRARGASPKQLFTAAVVEAVMLVVPAAFLAPWFASTLLRLLDDRGPLASIGLAIEPVVVTGAFAAVGVAAMCTVVLFSLPVLRSAREAQRVGARHRRQRRASAVQRAGLDVAFAVLAGAALWQLDSLGSQRSGRVGSRFGVDPLLVAAPVLGLFAGAFLALRIVPLLSRLLERSIPSGRGIVPALMSWQIARRPVRYSRSALLLITAVAIGIFAASYEATWSVSQNDQATQQVGADARSTPNRRTNDSIVDLQLVSAHEQLDGIERSMAVIRRSGPLENSPLPARYIALDAEAAGSVLLARNDLIADVPAAMAQLAAARPSLATIEVPGEPTALVVSITAREEEVFDRDKRPIEIGFGGSVRLIVQDGHGLLHRITAGDVKADGEPRRLVADLMAPLPDGTTASPTYPLSVVEIEIRTVAPSRPGRSVEVELHLAAAQADGEEVAMDLSGRSFTTGHVVLGLLTEAASIGSSAQQPAVGRSIAIETGSSPLAIPVTFGLRPSGTELPDAFDVIVTRSWLDAANRREGDIVTLGSLRTLLASARIAGSIGAFPTVDPSAAEAVVLDLPTLQMVDYALARPIASIDEHWFALSSQPSAIGRQLERIPFEVVTFVGREQRTEELQTDPPALGTIGALTIGFVAAAVFAAVGFLVSAAVSARERVTEFALLRALGLSSGQLAGWMMAEQAIVVVISLGFGTVIGLALSVGVLPLVSLTQQGAVVFPDVRVVLPWRSIILLELGLTIGLTVVVAGVNASTGRLRLGAALRQGEDR
jgi:hypothetical protein